MLFQAGPETGMANLWLLLFLFQKKPPGFSDVGILTLFQDTCA